MYHHIDQWERRQIYAYLLEWHKVPKIAILLWRPKKTLYEEIERNSVDGKYMPLRAQREAEFRRTEANKQRRKVVYGWELSQVITKRLIEDKRMPDSIVWYMRSQWENFVCTQTVYDYINNHDPGLKKYLKYKKWYKKRKNVVAKNMKSWFRSIEDRPAEIETRERIGDMEVDTVVSSWTERKWWSVTLVDRKSKFVVWWLVKQKTKDAVTKVILREARKLPKEKLLTITSDNGKEFNGFKQIEKKLRIKMYFAHPFASYEIWTNEQTNWMLRVFYPKGTDFTRVCEREFQRVLHIINRKPRKSLWYLCAEEVYYWVKLNL